MILNVNTLNVFDNSDFRSHIYIVRNHVPCLKTSCCVLFNHYTQHIVVNLEIEHGE